MLAVSNPVYAHLSGFVPVAGDPNCIEANVADRLFAPDPTDAEKALLEARYDEVKASMHSLTAQATQQEGEEPLPTAVRSNLMWADASWHHAGISGPLGRDARGSVSVHVSNLLPSPNIGTIQQPHHIGPVSATKHHVNGSVRAVTTAVRIPGYANSIFYRQALRLQTIEERAGVPHQLQWTQAGFSQLTTQRYQALKASLIQPQLEPYFLSGPVSCFVSSKTLSDQVVFQMRSYANLDELLNDFENPQTQSIFHSRDALDWSADHKSRYVLQYQHDGFKFGRTENGCLNINIVPFCANEKRALIASQSITPLALPDHETAVEETVGTAMPNVEPKSIGGSLFMSYRSAKETARCALKDANDEGIHVMARVLAENEENERIDFLLRKPHPSDDEVFEVAEWFERSVGSSTVWPYAPFELYEVGTDRFIINTATISHNAAAMKAIYRDCFWRGHGTVSEEETTRAIRRALRDDNANIANICPPNQQNLGYLLGQDAYNETAVRLLGTLGKLNALMCARGLPEPGFSSPYEQLIIENTASRDDRDVRENLMQFSRGAYSNYTAIRIHATLLFPNDAEAQADFYDFFAGSVRSLAPRVIQSLNELGIDVDGGFRPGFLDVLAASEDPVIREVTREHPEDILLRAAGIDMLARSVRGESAHFGPWHLDIQHMWRAAERAGFLIWAMSPIGLRDHLREEARQFIKSAAHELRRFLGELAWVSATTVGEG